MFSIRRSNSKLQEEILSNKSQVMEKSVEIIKMMNTELDGLKPAAVKQPQSDPNPPAPAAQPAQPKTGN